MRLCILFLFSGITLCMAGNAYAQQTEITLRCTRTPVTGVLEAIEKQTEFTFVYDNKAVDTSRPVSIEATRKNIFDVLSQLFDGTGTAYTVVNKKIILNDEKELTALQRQEVKGVVTDENGEPVTGANVVEKGVVNGTVTDVNGAFLLTVSPGAVLQVSYIGYENKEVATSGTGLLRIMLKPDVVVMDEVVVVGYGTQKKSSMTAAVASVSSEEIRKQIAPTVAAALQGRTPGVEVIQQGGEAGAEVKILVRGAGSFGATEPLYVIDGAFSNNGLNALNPADIESVEILKDGAAAAIYGSRAANGVVLITTKPGRKGKPVVDISASYSVQTPSKKLDFMNAEQYRLFANRIAENSGIAPAPENIAPSHPETHTDWQNEYLRTAPIYNVNASISGGSEYSTFNTSIGYLKQEGISVFSGFEKYNARVNGTYKKGRLSVTENLAVACSGKQPKQRMVMGLPTQPVKDGQGRYVSVGPEYYVVPATAINPLAARAHTNIKNSTADVTGSLAARLKLWKGLNYKINFGASYLGLHDYSHTSQYETLWDETGAPLSDYSQPYTSLSESRGTSFNYTIDNLLTYNNTFAGHTFDVLLGTSWMREYNRTTGISSDNKDLGGPTVTVYNGTGSITGEEMNSALLSFFGRLNYDYKNRYLFSASLRRDESSKFGKHNRAGYFPSVSAGWNIHEEGFFNVPWISKLKLRFSYGELGANFIDPYSFLSLAYGPIPAIFGAGQSADTRRLGYVTRFAQENLTWETAVSKNLGVEMSFFDNRLYFTAEYFRKDNNDLLAPLMPLASSGQTIIVNEGVQPVFNSASVQNKGLELTAGFRKDFGDFSVDLQGNISFIRNRVKTLGEGVQPIKAEVFTSGNFNDRPTITKPGLPIGTFWGYKVLGIDNKGDFIFEDNNGPDADGNLTGKPDGSVDENDKTNIGSPHPDFTYGLNLSMNYRNFDFTLFLQGSQGNEIFNLMKYDYYFNYNAACLTDALNGWRPDHTDTDVPVMKRNNVNGGNALPSTFYIENGSYLRCKNLQIGYSLPDRLLAGAKISKARVYASAQNLFTLTCYSGYDPEVNSSALFDRGVDGFYIPQNSAHAPTVNARIFTVGLNLVF